jgi:hypothetical protein
VRVCVRACVCVCVCVCVRARARVCACLPCRCMLSAARKACVSAFAANQAIVVVTTSSPPLTLAGVDGSSGRPPRSSSPSASPHLRLLLCLSSVGSTPLPSSGSPPPQRPTAQRKVGRKRDMAVALSAKQVKHKKQMKLLAISESIVPSKSGKHYTTVVCCYFTRLTISAEASERRHRQHQRVLTRLGHGKTVNTLVRNAKAQRRCQEARKVWNKVFTFGMRRKELPAASRTFSCISSLRWSRLDDAAHRSIPRSFWCVMSSRTTARNPSLARRNAPFFWSS